VDLKETGTVGDLIGEHWYYKSKAAAMMQLLGTAHATRILDVGAGSGFFSQYLLANSTATEAWCVDISYAGDSDAEKFGKPIHFRRAAAGTGADVVLLMDVLEHVDDDVGLLTEYAKATQKGTRFLISVPAFQFLWSGHDEFLEHKRRYTLRELEDVVDRSGLRVMHGTYFFGLVFPFAVATRLASRLHRSRDEPPRSQLKNHSAPVNSALAAVCMAELPLLAVNRLAGLTAFCLAERL